MTESRIKSKSVLMLTLLLLAPIVLLSTTPVVHAATPTISLSLTSGTGNGVTTGIKVTGTGFPQLKTGTGVALCYVSTSKSIACATSVSFYGESLRLGVETAGGTATVNCGALTGTQANYPSAGITTSCPPAGQASVDANGNFIAYFDVPNLAGDTYNVYVTYTPTGGSVTNSSPVTFTLAPYLDVRLATDLAAGAYLPTTRSAHWGSWVRIRALGFGPSETVTVTGIPSPIGTTVSLATDTNGCSGYASTACPSSPTFVRLTGETTGGSKTFTAVGGSSGLTATRSFTINPAIVLYTSQTVTTTVISIPAAAPASVFVEIHGFANAETISAASVGGQAANFGAVTTTPAGAFGV
jgi:hypothetical protein